MTKQYSIMTSASEYVTGIEAGAISTVANVKHAKRFEREEVQQALKTIKSKYDSGAEMFENPSEEK